MSQYAQDSDTEDSDDDVDTSLYNVETGLCNLNVLYFVVHARCC